MLHMSHYISTKDPHVADSFLTKFHLDGFRRVPIYGIDTVKQSLFFIYGLQVHRGRTPHGGVTYLESQGCDI